MRHSLKLALMLFPLWIALTIPAGLAQTDDEFGDRQLLSAAQGQAVADFALQSGPRVRPKPDCSHLVHLLYARAGLNYPYEDSRVLYRGVADFERVKTPQPGDLVVWLGHVGIVLSPEEATFLSSVRSGIITESWKVSHWAARGRPHFFRYRVGPAANLTLLAAIMDDDGNARNESHSMARSSASVGHPFHAPTPDNVQGDVPADMKNREAEEPAAQTGHDEVFARDEPQDAAANQAGVDSRSIVALIQQHGKPGKREIVAAVMESSSARARGLIEGETLDLGHPISVFDRVEVAKIKITHEHGSLTLRLSETVSQEAGRVLAARTVERELLMDRRRDGVWVISDPSERIYLPQAQALAVFERKAEIFLRRASNSTATRTVVKTLDRLYDQQPGNQRRAAVK